ncbi:4'-phosphopantetheinyl transferase family protein [Paenibacillus sp. NPDC093718]|uniref:4'-phosphopantetheinyl transferase family protein n=1 Tax=Paenibacillus sp. NPDC093718 TaxID=3390601 RepID=UPI003D04121B
MYQHQPSFKLRLQANEEAASAAVSFCTLEWPEITHNRVEQTLHSKEQVLFRGYPTHRRKLSFLRGRYAAKQALIHYQSTNLHQICIEQGAFQHPIVTEQASLSAQISITHTDGMAAAVAFPAAQPMGIDIQDLNPDHLSLIEGESTKAEIDRLRTLPFSYSVALTLLWTAKEALSKVLRTGLTLPLTLYEVKDMTTHGKGILSTYTRFSQYQTFSFIYQNHACSICYPKLTQIDWLCLELSEMLKEGNSFS